MASQEEIRTIRIQKLKQLEVLGKAPYPNKVPMDLTLLEVKTTFESLEKLSEEKNIAGRIMAIRGQGAILFVVLYDGTAQFQIVLKKDVLSEEVLQQFTDLIDIGDFVSFSGTFFVTQRGEQSMQATSFLLATKSLLSLPEKWHGIQDDDERFRKRYLDILTNTEVRDMFVLKAKFWKIVRNFLEDKGFMAVDTPTLEVTTGGAEAAPFATHHNDYDLAVYLRISVGELWQKRLMAAGFPKTYEIGRVYRNEGSSPNHLQEFTNMEFYWAYADYTMGMDLVKEMYRKIANDVFEKTAFTTRGHMFDLNDEWVVIRYTEEIKKQTNIDVLTATEDDLVSKLTELHIKYDGKTKERMVDALWKYCRKNISGPAFVIQYPDFMQPLAKRDAKNPKFVEQFQVLIGGSELGKGYSELNDPLDQRARFEHQQELLKAGDNEAMMPDWEFVEMLEHGMPPTCGFGFGERVFSFLVDKPIRETQLFPLMKPRE